MSIVEDNDKTDWLGRIEDVSTLEGDTFFSDVWVDAMDDVGFVVDVDCLDGVEGDGCLEDGVEGKGCLEGEGCLIDGVEGDSCLGVDDCLIDGVEVDGCLEGDDCLIDGVEGDGCLGVDDCLIDGVTILEDKATSLIPDDSTAIIDFSPSFLFFLPSSLSFENLLSLLLKNWLIEVEAGRFFIFSCSFFWFALANVDALQKSEVGTVFAKAIRFNCECISSSSSSSSSSLSVK